jgi:hypothetical protein
LAKKEHSRAPGMGNDARTPEEATARSRLLTRLTSATSDAERIAAFLDARADGARDIDLRAILEENSTMRRAAEREAARSAARTRRADDRKQREQRVAPTLRTHQRDPERRRRFGEALASFIVDVTRDVEALIFNSLDAGESAAMRAATIAAEIEASIAEASAGGLLGLTRALDDDAFGSMVEQFVPLLRSAWNETASTRKPAALRQIRGRQPQESTHDGLRWAARRERVARHVVHLGLRLAGLPGEEIARVTSGTRTEDAREDARLVAAAQAAWDRSFSTPEDADPKGK